MSKQFILGSDKVYVWTIDLNHRQENLLEYEGLLSASEQERANAFHFAHLRQRYILRRAAYRQILSICLNCPPQDIKFSSNAFGRPELHPCHNNTSLIFNTSSSEDIALFACRLNGSIGVDIEKKRNFDDPDQLIESFFSETEKTQWQAMADQEKHNAFFTGWTRKEAYVKALGQGLSLDLTSFSISFDPACNDLLNPKENWRFYTFDPIAGYRASLVYQGAPDIVFMGDGL